MQTDKYRFVRPARSSPCLVIASNISGNRVTTSNSQVMPGNLIVQTPIHRNPASLQIYLDNYLIDERDQSLAFRFPFTITFLGLLEAHRWRRSQAIQLLSPVLHPAG